MVKEIYSFDLYEEFIKDVSGNSNFADPHFEFDNSNLYDSLKKDNRKAYIVTEGEKVNGLFVWLILPDEKYIEMLIGLSKEESSIREMLEFIEYEYKGYQLDFVINPQHNLFCNLLKSKNAKFEEEQQWMAWEKEIENQYQHEIVLLTQKYESQYIDKHNKDTYWTAEKVMKAKDRFRVFLAIHEEKVVGYMDVTYCYEENEPYDIWLDTEFQGKGYEQALLQAAIKMNKPKKMMVLIDVNNHEEIEMFKSIGFVAVVGTNSVYATYKS
ncbi:MAG: GNAT family N-acetyltransferase [Lachnospiraceae bacterium]